MPISVEPCNNYQAGIYTLIVRLPTGGQSHTPTGSSGLAMASSLCQLTQVSWIANIHISNYFGF